MRGPPGTGRWPVDTVKDKGYTLGRRNSQPEQFQVTAKKTSVMGTRQTAVNVHRSTPSLLARFTRLARTAGIATTTLAIELEAVYRYFIVRHTIVQPSFGDSKNEEALGDNKFFDFI